ncbi:IS30 family transposase, partial [Aerococcaceae bacterium zg-ZJ1578]|uniref:IS30 family transposase n=2 Tax=Aerococcaceae bacterium zg-252 TaxID=2796928 RepID=UPI001A1A90AA|nr:IS30 family transposase [Aerococcaceae bacterium zg-1578]
MKYSPEMIVGRKIVNVSVSTIYYWIHHGHIGLSPKDLLYPRKNKVLRKKQSENFRIKGKSIECRPDNINKRLEPGHYEIDTVILSKASKPCLLVMTDRCTRHQIIRLIPNKTAKAVNEQVALLTKAFDIKSITSDNGTEFFRLHEVFDDHSIYYAHPYCSHERGTNENHNRLIRRFLPKGTKETTPEVVAKIENWINHYPKKIFGYKTPFEMTYTG